MHPNEPPLICESALTFNLIKYKEMAKALMPCKWQISIWRLYFIKRALSESESDENEQEKSDPETGDTTSASHPPPDPAQFRSASPHSTFPFSSRSSLCASRIRVALRINLHISCQTSGFFG
jgi:hypothetical protein